MASDSTKKLKEVKLKSEMYNNNHEKLEKREEEDSVLWGFVIGFALFFVLIILIIVFTN